MSIEERCAKFHAAAVGDGTGASDGLAEKRAAKRPAEIKKLRTFLHKNQNHRFDDKSQTYLFQSVMAHAKEAPTEGGSELLEDALKMPFTVFTTAHKKKMLALHAKLTGDEAAADDNADNAGGTDTVLQVIDVAEGGTVTLMEPETGDTADVGDADMPAGLAADIRARFNAGHVVEVVARREGDRWTVRAVK
ncbi:unnamed protein product [Pedinophyceae sp. YPF-701]|nr:unnamed protein product [Pedinophyceae sp. YPF-701]